MVTWTKGRGVCFASAGLMLAAALCAPAQVHAEDSAPDVEGLSRLSLEELGDLPVTSVSRTPEPLRNAPAAVYVITSDAIARAGALTLPEALRLAPNLQVAQGDATTYAISARGFNHSTSTANKLQVLIDGRTVYTPLFSGVFWDVQDTPLDEIDRVEVISGPAGSTWGANAVNGVINVTSRGSDATQGGLLRLGSGTTMGQVYARYGGRLTPSTTWRVYLQGDSRGPSARQSGREAFDEWSKTQGGFRVDWKGAGDSLTVQGDLYGSSSEKPPSGIVAPSANGGNLMARWTREVGQGGGFTVQAYYDRAEREVSSRARAAVDTYDLDLRYDAAPHGRHALVLGGGYRLTSDDFVRGPMTAFLDPASRDLRTANLFAQDQVALTDDLRPTLGLRLEHNSYTGLEYLPNVRLAWAPSERTLIWGAVSRGVRTPSRYDRDLVNGVILAGGPDFVSERLIAYELGYRGRPAANLSVSLSVFYNDYDRLRTVEITPATFYPLVVRNGMEGQTWGAEGWADWDVSRRWRLSAGFSTLRKDLRVKTGSLDVFGVAFAGNDPDWQGQLRSSFQLTDRLDFDLSLRSVDALPSPAVPAYTEADARVTWRLTDNLDVTVAGYNLLHDQHEEFASSAIPLREIRRSGYVSLRARF